MLGFVGAITHEKWFLFSRSPSLLTSKIQTPVQCYDKCIEGKEQSAMKRMTERRSLGDTSLKSEKELAKGRGGESPLS
jgi:hypothetical protein